MNKKEFLTFGAPVIEHTEISEVVDSLRSGWLGTGPKVARFEADFANYKECTNNAAVNSGTAALHLSLIVAGLRPGDEVITTAMTFCSTVNAIIHAGATPVLVDIDPTTKNIDPALIEAKVTDRTRAILVVHYAGIPCDMDYICQIACKYNLKIVEDCAHAIESEYKGQKIGTIGDFGCFSFYVTKNIVTGEGGMVFAKKKEDIDRIKILALHGMSKDAWCRFSDEGYKHYFVTECGYKYNMMDIQASLGIQQLRKIKMFWKRRHQIYSQYQDAFKDLPIGLPLLDLPECRHAYHLYTISVDGNRCGIMRDEFLKAMTELGIGVGVHYLSIPEHPYYCSEFGWDPPDYPVAMTYGRQTVSLPLSAKLADREVARVIEAVHKVIGGSAG
jgi:dTDP-4-amino-4,6-dideoxygalactose transaminase|tara:strand:+ start:1608 stop:2771 length:1164 start_codon:yes stop_codon:yes gene_type:complete